VVAVASGTSSISASGSIGSLGAARANRSAGGRSPSDWWGRSVLYFTTQASSAAWASSMVACVRSWSTRNSSRYVRWKRSTLPVVVGE